MVEKKINILFCGWDTTAKLLFDFSGCVTRASHRERGHCWALFLPSWKESRELFWIKKTWVWRSSIYLVCPKKEVVWGLREGMRGKTIFFFFKLKVGVLIEGKFFICKPELELNQLRLEHKGWGFIWRGKNTSTKFRTGWSWCLFQVFIWVS